MTPQDLYHWARFETTFKGNRWNVEDDIYRDFNLPDDFKRPERVLIAYYSYADYDGEAFVLYLDNFKLYEVNGSHCSCYGLEGQWQPEEANVDELRQRIVKGRLGRTYRGEHFAIELLDSLDTYEYYIAQAKKAGFIE